MSQPHHKQQQQQQHHQQHQKQVVTVFGATGKQGGAVISSLLKDGSYKLRGVGRSRDEKDFSQLQQKGVEMIQANICTGEGLDAAFKDAYAAFLITPSFDKEIEGNEYECGRKLVDKAIQHGVKVLIWSTLPNAEKISHGKYNVPHFTEKAKVEEYIRKVEKPKDFEAAVFIAPSFYFQNFDWEAFRPHEQDNTLVFQLPKTRTLTACDVQDMGPLVQKILQSPSKYNEKIVLLVGEQSSPQHFVETFSKVTGKKAQLKEIEYEEFKRSGKSHHYDQIAQMFAFMNEFTYFGDQEKQTGIIQAREIFPEVKNWEQYLRTTGWQGGHHP